MPAALGMLHGQYVDGFTFDSVIQLLVTHPKLITEVISLRSGPSLAFGRNKMTEVFMESTDSDWLFCLDSDMVFQPEQIEDLIKTAEKENLKILGGLAWVCGEGEASPDNMRGNLWSKIGGKQAAPEHYPVNTLTKVAATGAACVLIHRDVFKAIGKSGWWNHIIDDSTDDQLGEDISFCQRATDAGFDIYVHTGIEFGHVKSQILTSRIAFSERNTNE